MFRSSSRRTPKLCEVLLETVGYVFDGDEDVMGSADYDVALVSEAVMVTFGGLTGTYLRRDDGTDSIECS